IDLFPQGTIDPSFSAQVRQWAEAVIGTGPRRPAPERIAIHLWEKERDFQEFDAREKAELGITTGGESEFLATHEAWRGFPRIHVSLKKIRGLPGRWSRAWSSTSSPTPCFTAARSFISSVFPGPCRTPAAPPAWISRCYSRGFICWRWPSRMWKWSASWPQRAWDSA
ncbi:MAG: hypothetical protein HY882_13765, partial [Deltaproteobacteria bacterium]|nr:hypothetical protein [Deltaproteobacteria bacterium]